MKPSLPFIQKSFVCALLIVFPSTQSFALTETTRAELFVSQSLRGLTELEAHPERAMGFVDQLETEINTHLDSALQMDEADAGTRGQSPRAARIEARWKKRIAKRAERMIRKQERKIDQTSESGATKSALKAEYAETIHVAAESLPRQIAQAGGIFPYALHLKKNLKSLREQMKGAKGQTLRCILIYIATITIFLGIIFAGVLLAISWGVILGYLIIPVSIAVGMVAALWVDTTLEGKRGCGGI